MQTVLGNPTRKRGIRVAGSSLMRRVVNNQGYCLPRHTLFVKQIVAPEFRF